MVVYWGGTKSVLNDLSGVKASTWYHFIVEFTKLGATSAGIVGTLTELNATGGLIGTPYVGTVPDSSTFANPGPAGRFTSANQWPSYKNYNGTEGNADNASFSIVPEPSCIALFSLIGLPLSLRRRRN